MESYILIYSCAALNEITFASVGFSVEETFYCPYQA